MSLYKPEKSVLIEDPKLPHQQWALASFVSPVDRIKQRFFFEANKFLHSNINKQIADVSKQLTIDTNTNLYNTFDDYIKKYKSSSNEYNEIVVNVLNDIKKQMLLDETTRVANAIRQYKLNYNELIDEFDQYKIDNYDFLLNEFKSTHGDEISTYGIKIREVFATNEDAQSKAPYYINIEPNIHTIIVPVGYWFPFTVDPNIAKDQKYQIEQLNEIMTNYNTNREQANAYHQQRLDQVHEEKNVKEQEKKSTKLKELIKEKRKKEQNL
jgi:hypothetical protein